MFVIKVAVLTLIIIGVAPIIGLLMTHEDTSLQYKTVIVVAIIAVVIVFWGESLSQDRESKTSAAVNEAYESGYNCGYEAGLVARDEQNNYYGRLYDIFSSIPTKADYDDGWYSSREFIDLTDEACDELWLLLQDMSEGK